MNLFKKTLTKSQLITELKQVNKDRIKLSEDYKKGIIKEEYFNIEYFGLYDRLDNWEKYYIIKN